MVMRGRLHHMGTHLLLSAAFAYRTHRKTQGIRPIALQDSHMAVLADVRLIAERFQLLLLLLHRAETEIAEGVHLRTAFGTTATGGLLDLVSEDQDKDPPHPNRHPTGEPGQLVLVGLLIDGLGKQIPLGKLIGRS